LDEAKYGDDLMLKECGIKAGTHLMLTIKKKEIKVVIKVVNGKEKRLYIFD